MKRWHSTIRVRLTLHYTVALLLAGAILMTVLYVSLAQALDGQLVAQIDAVRQTHQTAGHTATEVAQLAAQFRDDRDRVLRTTLIVSLLSLVSVGAIATAVGWFMAGRALRPLHDISATARRVAENRLDARIALAGPDDEIRELADTFDEMLERLDRSFDSQRRFVANASHELRTPLTLNRTLIEVTLDGPDVPEVARQMGTTLLAINERHERLIDGLLILARAEQAVTQRVRTDLAEIVGHVLSQLVVENVDVRAELRPAVVVGDPVLLERLAANLIDNAVLYNLPEGGVLSVRTGLVDGFAELHVENTGPVVAAHEIPGLFEPFRRLSTTDRRAANGTGLGLSIVKAVAQAHGGNVEAEPREDGGLRVEVHLPAA